MTLVEEHPSWWSGRGADGFGPVEAWLYVGVVVLRDL